MTEPRPGVPVPPDELIREWRGSQSTYTAEQRKAAAWGADEQLRLCVEWVRDHAVWEVSARYAESLYAAMRPELRK